MFMQVLDVQGSTALPRETPVGEKVMRARYRPFVALATAVLANCGGTGGHQTTNPVSNPNDPSAPMPAGGPFLDYDRPLVFTLGVSETMGPDDVSPETTITASPALPAGLTLDASSGAISGTPTALSPGQSYTLSAVNAQGTVAAKMNLEVNDGPLFYSSPAILAAGTAITPLTPSGTIYLSSYSVSPVLPTGLSLDTTTGVISGTPTEASPTTYYKIIGADAGFSREYGLTLGVADSLVPAAGISSAPNNCVFSGGFVGTFSADSLGRGYGLIAIAFTPDGRAHARVSDLTTGVAHDSDGLEGLSAAMDGSFLINFSSQSNLSVRGQFTGPDLISGTYRNGSVSKPFTASRLGGSSSATYRYTGGFGSDNGYRVDFGTIDITGSALTGAGYQMRDVGQDFVLINRQLSFGTTISDGMFTITVDSSTTNGAYVPGHSLALGDPYDSLFYIRTYGCQLN
jgi:Putative Ig domain